jgi:hypothetical protein
MMMKMQMIQFVSSVNWIQIKSSEDNSDHQKAAIPSLKLISESKLGQSDPGCRLKTDPSDESNQLNHHAQQVDAHKHQLFQHWYFFVQIGEQSWK